MLTFGLTFMSLFSALLLLMMFRLFNKPWCGGAHLLGISILGYVIGIASTLIGIIAWAVGALL